VWPQQQGRLTFFKPSEEPALDNAGDDKSLHAFGIRLRTLVAGDLTAVRFRKAEQEEGARHNVRIVDWDTGALLSSVTNVDDGMCQGPTWVSIPLSPPLRTRVGMTYLVYVDNIMYFSRTDNFYKGPMTRSQLTIQGSTSGQAGYVPWDTYWQATNYWVDGAFGSSILILLY
jgi:hypothetical protein